MILLDTHLEREPSQKQLESFVFDLNQKLETLSPLERVSYLIKNFKKRLFVTTSGGRNSGYMLGLLEKANNQEEKKKDSTKESHSIPVLFFDQHNHPNDTIDYLAYLDNIFSSFHIERYAYDMQDSSQVKQIESHLRYSIRKKEDPLAAYINLAKNSVFQQVLKKIERERGTLDIWISGNRRDQSKSRKSLPFVSLQKVSQRTIVKVYPLADQTAEQGEFFRKTHGIKEHPLDSTKYPSIGILLEMNPLKQKTLVEKEGRIHNECGLHKDQPIHSEVPFLKVEFWQKRLKIDPKIEKIIKIWKQNLFPQ